LRHKLDQIPLLLGPLGRERSAREVTRFVAALPSKPEVHSLYCVDDEDEELPLPLQLKIYTFAAILQYIYC